MGDISILQAWKKIKSGNKLGYSNKLKHEDLESIKDFENYVKHESYPDEPFSKFMSFIFVPRYENNILALVYGGAAFLVMVLGLRGLSTKIWDIAPWICGDDHRLKVGIILIALILEFLMILALAITMWNKIEDNKSVFDTCDDNNDGGLHFRQTGSGPIPSPRQSSGAEISIEMAFQAFKEESEKVMKRIELEYKILELTKKGAEDTKEQIEKLKKKYE